MNRFLIAATAAIVLSPVLIGCGDKVTVPEPEGPLKSVTLSRFGPDTTIVPDTIIVGPDTTITDSLVIVLDSLRVSFTAEGWYAAAALEARDSSQAFVPVGEIPFGTLRHFDIRWRDYFTSSYGGWVLVRLYLDAAHSRYALRSERFIP